MIPLKDIKIKSAKMRKKDGKIKIQPADSCNSYFKRDVTSIMKKLNDSIEKEKALESHIYIFCANEIRNWQNIITGTVLKL